VQPSAASAFVITATRPYLATFRAYVSPAMPEPTMT
jgi:hypothetical protein